MKILINYINGGVGIMQVFNNADVQECIDKWKGINVGMYLNHRAINDVDIPTDNTYRDAWEDTGVVSVNMPKARDIHLNDIRVKRNSELAKLDIEAMKAQDMGDTEALTRVRIRKQELRDLPATLASALANAVTTDELKAIQPLI